MTTPRTTHADRANLRAAMAAEVKAGETIGTVAGRHRVSVMTVRRACEENGVQLADGRSVRRVAALA